MKLDKIIDKIIRNNVGRKIIILDNYKTGIGTRNSLIVSDIEMLEGHLCFLGRCGYYIGTDWFEKGWVKWA